MSDLHYLPEIFLLLMLAIVYLQSGIDKITDRKGNLEFMNSHFAKSPFKNMVSLLLAMVTVMEILSGVFAVLGIIMLLATGATGFAIIAAVLSLINFSSLLLGQRIAKDYGGAMAIVVYMIPTVFLLYLLVK